MPWKECKPMDERLKFIARLLEGEKMAPVCREFGISRVTGYKIFNRYKDCGLDGLNDRARRPYRQANKLPFQVERTLLGIKRKNTSWGAPKIRDKLIREYPMIKPPAISTIHAVLDRNGLVKRRKRRRHKAQGTVLVAAHSPNGLWCADYKGEFKLGNKQYCYPLTITDYRSRYLLACEGLACTRSEFAFSVFERAFKDFGLPNAIRTDNGVPFATTTLARLSKLSAWWVRLGVLPELIEPGKPQQNGRHERMHRTLKAEAIRPPAGSLPAQQRKFNHFREEYNEERPHEALDQETPASVYEPSPREMSAKVPPLEYPDRFEVRYVSANGGIRWNSSWVNVSTVCSGDYIGLEELDDGVWTVYYGPLKIGRFHERHMRIEDEYGRLKR